MTLQIVEDRGVASINASRYWIAPGPPDVDHPTGRPGRVTTQIASRFPPKLVTGDTNKDSDPTRSSVTWSDARGGWGVESQRDQSDIDRCWYSWLNLSHDTHLTLRPLETSTGSVPGSNLEIFGELANELYASFATGAIHKYDNGGDTWATAGLLDTMPAAATDSLTLRLNGTVYLVFAHTSGWTHTSDGSSFTDLTDDALFLASFDDKLWTIDNTGQLRSYSDVAATAVTGPQLPLPNGSVKALVKGRDADGNQILMASTTVGLYAADLGNRKFVEVEPPFPNSPNNGLAVRWRDAVYYVAGGSVFKFNQGSRTAVIQPMGPDLDHGLAQLFSGPITSIAASHNFLLIGINNDLGGGTSVILGWNGLGWQMVAHSIGFPEVVDPFVSSAYSTYRLYWGQTSAVEFTPLQEGVINPDHVATAPSYEAGGDPTGEHLFPEFDADQSRVEKLALSITVEVEEIGSGALGSVIVSYATNFNSSFTDLATISTAGETTLTFPDNGTNPDVGLLFRWIQLRLRMARSTATSTPDVRSVTLEYRKKLPEKLGFRVQLDLTQVSPDGKTPQEQLADLVTARGSSTLVEFTFRSDDSGNRTYYTDIQDASSNEDTGLDEAGIATLVLVEP